MKYLRLGDVSPKNLPELGVIRKVKVPVEDQFGGWHKAFLISWADDTGVRQGHFDCETGEYLGEA